MTDQSRQDALDEKMDAVLETVAENTTTLFDVQKQAAATAASVKDARGYIQTTARNTDWDANAEKIAAVLTDALEKDHKALHAAARAADTMRGLSVELSHEARAAANAQQDASRAFHEASGRLLRVVEAHETGKWRRWGGMALTGALCAAVGFFAREPASEFQHVWDAGKAIQADVTSSECETQGGINLIVEGDRACVIKETNGG